jgi:hypothetical protein
MHDTILLNKISQGLDGCCKNNGILKINKLIVIVNEYSHVNSYNLYEYLRSYNGDLVGEWTEIKTEIGDLPDQTAIIRNIVGDVAEQ